MKHILAPVLSALLTSALLACGSAQPAEPVTPAPVAAEPAATEPVPAEGAAPAIAGPLTKANLDEMQTAVMNAYPAPFEETFAALTAHYGQPKKSSDNMFQWFAVDGEKCVSFFVTKDAAAGHAASGLLDADAADCQ